MNCKYCKAILPKDAVFCNICGRRQSEQPPAEQSMQTGNCVPQPVVNQPKKSRKSLLLTLSVVALLLALIIGGISVYRYYDQQNALFQVRAELARTTAQQFCNFLVKKDYQSAYNMLEPGSWSSLSDFRSYAEKNIYTLGKHNAPAGFLHVTECAQISISNPHTNNRYDIDGSFYFDDASMSSFSISLIWNENSSRFDVIVLDTIFVYP